MQVLGGLGNVSGISAGELNASAEALALTLPVYQARVLRVPACVFPHHCGNFAKGCLFSGRASGLDAFSSYRLGRSCSACPAGQPIHQRPRFTVPLVLDEPSPQAANNPCRYHRTGSRRTEPSSRAPLMGEQPHPW